MNLDFLLRYLTNSFAVPISCIMSLFFAGFKLAKKFREKFCLSPRKFGRSFYLNFRFAYIFYTFSLLSQLKIGNSLFIYGRLFFPSRPVGYSLMPISECRFSVNFFQ